MHIHHIGIVVKQIEAAYADYRSLGFSVATDFNSPKEDQEQKVRVGVVETEKCRLEFLEPLGAESPIAAAQEKGGGIHHVCLETDNLRQEIEKWKAAGARQLTPITVSVWEGRRVVFFATQNSAIFELIGPYGTE